MNQLTLPKNKAELDALTREQEQRVNKQVTNIVMLHPFFASLILNLKREPHYGVGTAATDGVRMYWNPLFIKAISDDEIRGVLAHEVMHCALGHIWRVKPEWQRDTANMAMDYAVNNFIDLYNQGQSDQSAKLPIPGTPYAEMKRRGKPKPGEFVNMTDHQYDDKSFEHIYSILLQDEDHQKMADQNTTMGDGEPGDDPGDQAGNQERPLGGDQPQDGDGDGDGEEDGDGQGNGQGKPSNKQGKGGGGGFQSVGEVMRPGVDPVTKEEVTQADWAQKATQAAQVARNMGKLPAEIERALGLGMKAQVDWASELSRFMDSQRNDDYSWQHFDRRHTGRGIYLPDMHSEGMGAIALIVDTSGSVDDNILNRMANEIQAISARLKPDKIVVVYCDADVQREEIFKPGDLVLLHPKGGGGTDFRPAFEHISREHPDIVVCAYFTDGYGTFPSQEPEYPVMWLTYGLDAKDYPFGHVVPVTI